MRTLGLDCGTVTGWYLSGHGGGAISLREFQDHAEARNAFANWLTHLLVEHPVALVAIERPVTRMPGLSAILALSLTHVAHDMSQRAGVQRVEYGADTVRKWLIGRARRGKEESVKAFDSIIAESVRQKLGYSVLNEHIADAAAIALYARFAGEQARAA